MEKIDEEIILECKGGNKEAFGKLVEKYTPSLYNFCARLAGKDNANDLSQETFMKAWRSLHRFNPEKASWKTWLFTIARNSTTDFLRKKKIPVITENDAEEDIFANIPDEELLPDEALQKIEDIKIVNELLNNLGPDHKMVLTLRYQEDMTFDEIGKVMQRPLDTVKSIHRRAIIALRKML